MRDLGQILFGILVVLWLEAGMEVALAQAPADGTLPMPTGAPQLQGNSGGGTPGGVPGDLPGEMPGEEVPSADLRDPEPWSGSFAEGMAQVIAQHDSEDYTQAIETCDQLLVATTYERMRSSLAETSGGLSDRVLAPVEGALHGIGLERFSVAERGQVCLARGLLSLREGNLTGGLEDLQAARRMGGGEATRFDAVYSLGTVHLGLGEAARQLIPEISGVAPTQPPAPAPGAQSPAPEPPDPLVLARSAYGHARTHLIERLRLDWRDEDTRANMELVQRRLRELDEIERQREEQQQEGEDPAEQGPDPDAEQEDSSDSDSQGGDSQQSDPPEEPESTDPSEDSEDSEDPEDPQDGSEGEDSQEQEGEQSQEGEIQEVQLTKEELDRLLRILQEHEEEGERLQELLSRRRRQNVERDW